MDEQHRQSVARMWELGDYRLVAERLRPAAEKLAEAVGAGHDRSALDVAAGTGSVAVALANRGWRVGAADIAPALIEHGREHTRGLGIDWHEASLDALPFPDDSLDLVASSFGLIFVPDPSAALAEIRRCLRTGGRLAFTAWTPDGYMGQMTAVMMGFLPSGPADAASPMDWGRPDVVSERLSAAGFTVSSSQLHAVPWEFDSPEAGTTFLFEHSPAHVASASVVADQAPAMIRAVRAHLAECAGTTDGPVRLAAEYTITLAEAT